MWHSKQTNKIDTTQHMPKYANSIWIQLEGAPNAHGSKVVCILGRWISASQWYLKLTCNISSTVSETQQQERSKPLQIISCKSAVLAMSLVKKTWMRLIFGSRLSAMDFLFRIESLWVPKIVKVAVCAIAYLRGIMQCCNKPATWP